MIKLHYPAEMFPGNKRPLNDIISYCSNVFDGNPEQIPHTYVIIVNSEQIIVYLEHSTEKSSSSKLRLSSYVTSIRRKRTN